MVKPRPTTIELINAILENQLCSLTATTLHIEHQLSLPIKHRVTEASQEELEEQAEELKDLITKFERAIADFNTSIL